MQPASRFAALLLLIATSALASGRVDTTFDATTAKSVGQGIQIIPGAAEIFIVGGTYYMRRDGKWYSTKTKGGGDWSESDGNHTPGALKQMPKDRYKSYGAGVTPTVTPDPKADKKAKGAKGTKTGKKAEPVPTAEPEFDLNAPQPDDTPE